MEGVFSNHVSSPRHVQAQTYQTCDDDGSGIELLKELALLLLLLLLLLYT